MSQPSKYFAFISYSRKDSKVAAWLQKRLEWFRFPVKLVPEDKRPTDPRYVRPIYRDKTSLEVTDEHYWKNIRRALEESRYLIVLCSPDSAASEPVNMEVAHYLATHAGDTSLLIPIIIRGSVSSGGENAALCPALHELGDLITGRNLPTMVPDLATDECEAFEAGFVALVSYLLQLDRSAIGDHIQRETRKQATILRRWLLAVGVLSLVSILAGTIAYLNGARALRNEKRAKEQEQVAIGNSVRAEANAVEAEKNARRAKEQENIANAKAVEARNNALEAQKNGAEATRQAEAVRARLREAARNDWIQAVDLLAKDRQSEAFAHLARAHEYDPKFLPPITTAMIALQDWQVTLPEFSVKAGQAEVRALRFIGEDAQFVTATEDGWVRCWTATEGKLVKEFHTQTSAVLRALFSPDGSTLLVSSHDAGVSLWDVATGKQLMHSPEHDGLAINLAFSPDGTRFATTGQDGSLILNWITDGSRRKLIVAKRDAIILGQVATKPVHVRSVAYSPDGKLVATGDGDGNIKICEGTTGELLRRTDNSPSEIMCIEFSPDGRFIAAGSSDGGIVVWTANDLRKVHSLRGHEGPVNSVHFGGLGELMFLVSASSDGTVRHWNLETGHARTDAHHTGLVIDAIPSPDLGRNVLTIAFDGTATLTDSGIQIDHSNHRSYTIDSPGKTFKAGCFDATGSRCLLGTADGIVLLFEPHENHTYRRETSIARVSNPENVVRRLEFASQGSLGVTAHSAGAVVVWDRDTGLIQQIINLWEKGRIGGGGHMLTDARLDPAGRALATASTDGEFHLWDAQSGEYGIGKNAGLLLGRFCWLPNGDIANDIALAPQQHAISLATDESDSPNIFKFHHAVVEELVFPPNGDLLATADVEGRVALWDLKTKRLRASLGEHKDGLFELTFNHQGTKICSASSDGYARVWETTNGGLVVALKHPNKVRSARFSPDGRTLLTASADSVRLYDIEQKQITLEFSAHESEIGAALYSADGKLIITCGLDATVRLWEASTGARLGILGGRITSAIDLQLSTDGRKLLVSHLDSTARLLDIPILPDALPSWWPPFLCAVSGRVISPAGSIVSLSLAEIRELKTTVLKQIEVDESLLDRLSKRMS